MIDWTARRLMRLLESERGFLVEGDIAGAAGLAETKEKLISRLENGTISPPMAQRLAKMAERNEALIVAARQGIEAAHGRLRTIRNGVSVNTYGAHGGRQLISRPQTTLHKRA